MSSSCVLTTVAVPLESLREGPQSYYEALDLINAGYEKGQFLSGRSSNEWLPSAVSKLSAAFSIEGLEFFCCEPWNTEHNCCTFFFSGSEVERICEAITVILARAQNQPDAVAKVLDAGYQAADILVALDRSKPSLKPKADDGEGVNFLFAYLKSLQCFSRTALAKGQGMVHAQWC